MPNTLVVSYEQPGIMPAPHWHAQVEINFMFRGALEYRMRGHSVELKAGELCLFWGGLPHQVIDTSNDAFFVAIHLPLVHFFRLQAAERAGPQADARRDARHHRRGRDGSASFARWVRYLRSSDRAQVDHAISELLLRIERIRFEPHYLVEPDGLPRPARRLRRPALLRQHRRASANSSPAISATTSTAPTSRRRSTSIRNTR